jgi:TPR repeat protein
MRWTAALLIACLAGCASNSVSSLKSRAESGNCDAQYDYGMYFFNKSSQGNPNRDQDNLMAVKWWIRAANQGHARAQWAMGDMSTKFNDTYYFCPNCDVKKDYPIAYMWYELALQNSTTPEERTGIEHAQNRLVLEMNKEQADKGKSLATGWKPTPSKCH